MSYLGRLFERVDLIKPVWNVRTYMHMHVHPSTERFFDFVEIRYVGRGRWVMHDCMQYDPIQGKGHELFNVGNPAIFKSYPLHHLQWELATDHWFLNYGTISKFDRARFLIFGLVFVSRDFEVGTVHPLRRVDSQSRTGLIFRFTSPSQPNNMGRKMSVCMYVRLSTKSFFNFNELWYCR